MKKNRMNIETVVRLFSTGVLMTVLGYIIYGAIAQATGEVSYYHEAIEALKDFRILAATIAAYGVLYVSTDALLFRPLLNVLSEAEMETPHKKDAVKAAGKFLVLCAIFFVVDRSNIIDNEGLTNVIVILMLGWKIVYELFFQSISINKKIQEKNNK